MGWMRVSLWALSGFPVYAFHFKTPLLINPTRTTAALRAAGDQGELVVVFGRSDGTAANIAHALGGNKFDVRACFHEMDSSSFELPPSCTFGPPIDLTSTGNGGVIASALSSASHVVIAADGAGASGSGASDAWLSSMGKALQDCESIESVVVVCPADGEESFSEAGSQADDASEDDSDGGLLSGAGLGESFSMPELPKLPDLGDVLAGAGGAVAENAAAAFGGGQSASSSIYANLKGGHGALVKSAAAASARSVSVVKHGRVFGGTPGNEPVPFVGGPMKDPVLDEHYAARAVILSGSDAILSTRDTNPLGKVQVRTSRSSLAELVARMLTRKKDKGKSLLPPLVTILSVDGLEPSEEEWEAQFRRLDPSQQQSGVELLRVDFETVSKEQALVQWITYDWGPNMLSTISTYTKRFGARPVVATPVKTEDSSQPALVCAVRVRWEDLKSDDTAFESVLVGSLLVSLTRSSSTTSDDSNSLALIVSREGAEAGSSLGEPLPGEEEVLQRLVEGLEKVVYAKGFATRPGTKAKLAAAALKSKAAQAQEEEKEEKVAAPAPLTPPAPKVETPSQASQEPAPSTTKAKSGATKPRRKKRPRL